MSNLSKTFGELRSLFAQEPSQAVFTEVLALLEDHDHHARHDRHDLDVALIPYCKEALERYPFGYRQARVQSSYVDRKLATSWDLTTNQSWFWSIPPREEQQVVAEIDTIHELVVSNFLANTGLYARCKAPLHLCVTQYQFAFAASHIKKALELLGKKLHALRIMKVSAQMIAEIANIPKGTSALKELYLECHHPIEESGLRELIRLGKDCDRHPIQKLELMFEMPYNEVIQALTSGELARDVTDLSMTFDCEYRRDRLQDDMIFWDMALLENTRLMSQIERLSLEGTGLRSYQWDSLTTSHSFPKLQHLSLRANHLNEGSMLLCQLLPQLVTVDLANNNLETIVSVYHRAELNPDLEYLDLSGNTLPESEVIHLLRQDLPRLRSLSLEKMNLTDKVAWTIAQNKSMVSLEYLYLGGNPEINFQSTTAIHEATHLKKLKGFEI